MTSERVIDMTSETMIDFVGIPSRGEMVAVTRISVRMRSYMSSTGSYGILK